MSARCRAATEQAVSNTTLSPGLCCAIGISRKLIQSLLVRTVTLYEATSEDEQNKVEAAAAAGDGQQDGGNPLADDDLPSASKPKPTAETFNAPSDPSKNLQRNTVVYVPIVRQT